jgi:hypothetical protein
LAKTSNEAIRLFIAFRLVLILSSEYLRVEEREKVVPRAVAKQITDEPNTFA